MDTWLRPPGPERLRLAGYLAVVLLLCGQTHLAGLDRGTLLLDEAHYAAVADRVRSEGRWLHLARVNQDSYFQKPPLAFWVAAAMRSILPDGPRAYRIGSALAATGAVAGTVVLGAWLFAAEVGLIAGLLLAVHPSWLFLRNARFFSLDPLLSLFAVGMLLSGWWVLRGRRRAGWLAAGLFAGAASLVKPLAGLFLLAGIAPWVVALDRGRGWYTRLGGPALALALATLVAGPWYLAQHVEYGSRIWEVMFGQSVLQRIVDGMPALDAPWWYYAAALPGSSWSFVPCWVAIAAGAWLALRGVHRRAWTFTVAPAVAIVLALSFSSVKQIRYAYPAFPLLAIAEAALAWWLLSQLLRTGSMRLRQAASLAVVVAAVGLAVQQAVVVLPPLADRYHAHRTYLPWWAHRWNQAGGQPPVRVLAVEPVDSSTHEARYYLRRMEGAVEHVSQEMMWAAAARPGPTLWIVPAGPAGRSIAAALEAAGFTVDGPSNGSVVHRDLPLPSWIERNRRLPPFLPPAPEFLTALTFGFPYP